MIEPRSSRAMEQAMTDAHQARADAFAAILRSLVESMRRKPQGTLAYR